MSKIQNLLNKFVFCKSPKVAKIIDKRKKSLSLSDNPLSIISNNCLAGTIYHDYGMEFRTPVINCYVSWLDYPRFILRIKEWVAAELVEVNVSDINFPIGRLQLKDESIDIYF